MLDTTSTAATDTRRTHYLCLSLTTSLHLLLTFLKFFELLLAHRISQL